MKKNFIALSALALALCMLFAGCGSQENLTGDLTMPETGSWDEAAQMIEEVTPMPDAPTIEDVESCELQPGWLNMYIEGYSQGKYLFAEVENGLWTISNTDGWQFGYDPETGDKGFMPSGEWTWEFDDINKAFVKSYLNKDGDYETVYIVREFELGAKPHETTFYLYAAGGSF